MGTLVERDPFRQIQGEVNRLFDSFFGRPTTTAGNRVWMPVVDMYEQGDDLVLNVELPGVSEKDTALSITGDTLTVKGERHFAENVTDENYFHSERAYGRFERSIRLPMPVDGGRVKATFRDGVLEVTLPKAEEVRPKDIKIDVA